VTRARLLIAATLLALAAGATSLSSGAFTATSANPNSTFTADASFPSTCTPGTVQLTATEDSYIVQNNPSTNNGSSTALRVVSRARANVNSEHRNERTLLKFALPERTGCSITSATLAMTGMGSTDAGRTIEAYSVGAAWSESTVTWANAPAPAGGAATAASSAAPSWTLTTLLQGQYSGPTASVGILLKDGSENSATQFTQQYRSSESTVPRPTLTVVLG
jgi:hypothetical protein